MGLFSLMVVVHLIIGFNLPQQIAGIIDISKPENPYPAIVGDECDFPWQVFLLVTRWFEGELKYSNCGGSIIDNQWILTAAHCLAEGDVGSYHIFANSIEISAGLINKNKAKAKRPLKKVDIRTNVFINENYNKIEEHESDIALIKLKEPLPYVKGIEPVELGNIDDIIPRKLIKISGWGCMSIEGNIALPDELRYIEMELKSTTGFCESNIQYKRYLENFLCSWNRKKSACSGDSGGPVVTGKGGTSFRPFVQIGVISSMSTRKKEKIENFGLPTWNSPSKGLLPSVFTNVAKFRDWIHTTMASNSDNGEGYQFDQHTGINSCNFDDELSRPLKTESLETDCPAPWFLVGDQCFQYIGYTDGYSQWKSWSEARDHCSKIALGGDLAQPKDVNSLAEYMGKEAHRGSFPYSIGASYSRRYRKWQWINGTTINEYNSDWYWHDELIGLDEKDRERELKSWSSSDECVVLLPSPQNKRIIAHDNCYVRDMFICERPIVVQ